MTSPRPTHRFTRVGLLAGFLAPLLASPLAAAAQGGSHACLIGPHEGFEDADARTATSIVCDAVRARGVALGTPATEAPADAGGAYRVSLERLGTSAFVTLQKERPLGTLVTQRRLQIARIEETPVVAPRLAEAVETNHSLETTRKVGNLSKTEGRQHAQLSGDFSWGPGVSGYYFIQTDVVGAPSPSVQFWYETDHLAIGSTLRFVLGEDVGSDDGMFAFIGDAGARYLFLAENTSPFVGGGLTFGAFQWTDRDGDEWDSDERTGFGGYLEGGVEFLRLHRTHFVANLRLDLPFFALKSEKYTGPVFNEDTLLWEDSRTSTKTRYIPAVSLGVGILF